MVLGNRLPHPHAFQINRLFFLFSDNCHEEDLQLIESYSFIITIADKVWFRGPVRRFRLNHWDLRQVMPEVRQAKNEAQRDSWYYVFNFEHPIILTTEYYFGVELQGRGFQTRPNYRGGAGIDFHMCLDGILTRGNS